MVANRADSVDVAGGGVYAQGQAIASWQPSAASQREAVVIGRVENVAATDPILLTAPTLADTASLLPAATNNAFPCASTASASFPMACIDATLNAGSMASVTSFSGNVSCTVSGQVAAAVAAAGPKVRLLLAAQDAMETFSGTPSPLPVRACALMLCVAQEDSKEESEQNHENGSTLHCDAVWPAPVEASGGLVLSMTQRATAYPYRVYPMLSQSNVSSAANGTRTGCPARARS